MVIMDSNDKGSESEDMQSPSPRPTNELKRCCVDCRATRTPCWRGGPAGPRTLCNACGIRYRKKRKALLGLVQGTAKKSNNKKAVKSSSSSSSSSISEGREMGLPLEAGLMGFVRGNKNNRNVVLPEKLKESREVEQAAILLMALSYGSVYA